MLSEKVGDVSPAGYTPDGVPPLCAIDYFPKDTPCPTPLLRLQIHDKRTLTIPFLPMARQATMSIGFLCVRKEMYELLD